MKLVLRVLAFLSNLIFLMGLAYEISLGRVFHRPDIFQLLILLMWFIVPMLNLVVLSRTYWIEGSRVFKIWAKKIRVKQEKELEEIEGTEK